MQIPLTIEQTTEQTSAPRVKRSFAAKMVVGSLAVFAVVCLYENGVPALGFVAPAVPRASRAATQPLPDIAAIVNQPVYPGASSAVAVPPTSRAASPVMNALNYVTETLAGVVAVDGGTVGLEVSGPAFLAVILGLGVPVVFLITLFIQSDAQGTATTFRQPDSIGGIRFEDE